ncbi:unnamed protein product [Rhizophagus irregularis]|nr:unnamed protein product [Rhizophagus irregularis]
MDDYVLKFHEHDVLQILEEDIKEGKKRVIGKQGDRSKAEEEESDEEEWTVSINKKRGGKPGSYGKGRGGRRRHINK